MKKKLRSLTAVLMAAVLLAGCAGQTGIQPSVEEPAAAADEALSESGKKADYEDENLSEKSEEEASSYSIEEKTLPVYMGDLAHKEEAGVFFINGSAVPYISMDTVLRFLNYIREEDIYDLESEGDHAVITRRGTDFTMDVDFDADTMSFFDFDAFLKPDIGPIVNVGIPNDTVMSALFEEDDYYSNERYGKEMCYDMKPYGIDLVHEGDGYYLPLQTVSDLLLTYEVTYALYNTEAVFVVSGGMDEEMSEKYYSASGERTEELGRFDYNELCFALDHMYGLKEIHNIDSFDEFFHECGLRRKLSGTDQTDADTALYKFIEQYLDDQHSRFNAGSYMSDPDRFSEETGDIMGPWKKKMYSYMYAFSDARDEFYPEGIPPYEEVGDTAYITFDSFTHPEEDIDYMSDPTEDELYDTVRLIQYSRDKILRPDSPVKNVVMDLSNNSGGAAATAAYVIAFYLGLGDMSVVNTMTGAAGTAAYHIDTNRDGKFDREDYLAGKDLNLYCLISPFSFSSGNLVPNVFMNSPRVTLIGMTSGGGSCGVQPMSTAGGTMLQISGYKRISLLKNGSYDDIDRGATPDFHIAKIRDFYDRERMTEWLDGLF